TRMRAAAADLDFEEAARLRDEIKRLRSTELAVLDDPTAKVVALPSSPRRTTRREGAPGGTSKVHKPALDEMGIALYHEVAPLRGKGGPRKPRLDDMGPGVESVPGRREASGPRSTHGKPGMRGGWKPRRR
ncbi:MAG: UvrB/UvrC motif-containing protein, partial [Hyphomicrobiales bacterium]|nr:UvrB/UvrC motif-containing protein [Hyphomicrobiales bacterium]